MRKLASIQKIEWVKPIEKRDFIELVGVLGWQAIVKKGEFQVGDKIIFVEVDSILPEKPEFEFLRKYNFRIKTQRMGNVLSQGLCLPLSLLSTDKNYKINEEVTDLLEIKKYETNEDDENREYENNLKKAKKFRHPIFKFLFRYSFFRKLLLNKEKKENKGFPDFISKTDETRIQSLPKFFEDKETKYVVREKIDGSSSSFFLRKIKTKWFWEKQRYDFGVCSRNQRLWNEFDTNFWKVAKKYKIKEILLDIIGDNLFVAIQGEVIAPNIQGNKYKVSQSDLYVFNLIYPTGKVNCLEAEETLKKYGLKWCPLVADDYILPETITELLDFATGKSALFDNLREGIVLRNYEKNISFKAISPDFQIKNNE